MLSITTAGTARSFECVWGCWSRRWSRAEASPPQTIRESSLLRVVGKLSRQDSGLSKRRESSKYSVTLGSRPATTRTAAHLSRHIAGGRLGGRPQTAARTERGGRPTFADEPSRFLNFAGFGSYF